MTELSYRRMPYYLDLDHRQQQFFDSAVDRGILAAIHGVSKTANPYRVRPSFGVDFRRAWNIGWELGRDLLDLNERLDV